MIFNNGFFPTPTHVIEKMIDGLKLAHKSVLDPSAGKGDILEYILARMPHYNRAPGRLYAIEINSDLRAILVDKGFPVIETDFLAFPGLQYFDFILMNPPFDEGAKHLLKAWDIANGAIIRCLLNSETLNNTHTDERKRLKSIIKRYGWSKELGQVFRKAERKTDVSVTLVHLHDTRKKEPFRLDFEPETMDERYKVEGMPADKALVSPNIFEAYEARYNAAIAAFKKLLLARQEVNYFLDPLLTEYNSGQKLVSEALKDSREVELSYEMFLKDATKAAWSNLFAKTKLGHVVTENVRKELEKVQAQQGIMSFTAENMELLFNQLFLSREQIMKNCILDSFDLITKYYDSNRIYVEGFKTNNAYFVGPRFILPNMGATWSEGLDYSSKQTVVDIEKGLSFLTGRKLETITSVGTIYDRKSHYGTKMQSTYFETKLYKRGTLHFRWIDDDLRQQFNAVVAKERFNFLPERIKKGFYV